MLRVGALEKRQQRRLRSNLDEAFHARAHQRVLSVDPHDRRRKLIRQQFDDQQRAQARTILGRVLHRPVHQDVGKHRRLRGSIHLLEEGVREGEGFADEIGNVATDEVARLGCLGPGCLENLIIRRTSTSAIFTGTSQNMELVRHW